MASARVDCSLAGKEERYSVLNRYPIRGTFFGCCASAITPRASNTVATRIAAAFFIAHLIPSVIYHADRDKGKCDLRAEGDRYSSSRKARISLRLCTTPQANLAGFSRWRIQFNSSV